MPLKYHRQPSVLNFLCNQLIRNKSIEEKLFVTVFKGLNIAKEEGLSVSVNGYKLELLDCMFIPVVMGKRPDNKQKSCLV